MAKNEKISIVFFGTGPVAFKSLRFLHKYFNIDMVLTKPSISSASRQNGQSVDFWARSNGINTLNPTSGDEVVKALLQTNIKSQIGVVVDYGIIIPEQAINMFPMGIVNGHFSLLPKWRGADPITFALLGGDKLTGVSIMLIAPKLDNGPLLAQEKLSIEKDETIISLTERLIKLSNKTLRQVLPDYVSGTIHPCPQDISQGLSFSRKVKKEDGLIDWLKPAVLLEREVRAYLGWPGSYTRLFGIDVIITKSHVIMGSAEPGETVTNTDRQLAVGTSEDILVIDRLKPAGKNEMDSNSFLNGLRSKDQLNLRRI